MNMGTRNWLLFSLIVLASIGLGFILGSTFSSHSTPTPKQEQTSISQIPESQPTQTKPIPSPTDMSAPYANGAMGFAISYPQCPKSFPNTPYEYGILGVNDGRSFTHNPCLKDEIAWAKTANNHPSFYINLGFPKDLYPTLIKSFNCVAGDQKCEAYHFGYATAQDAYNYASSQGLANVPWWLDMQTISTWSTDKNVNAQVVQGAADFYKKMSLPVGLSTTPYQWQKIAGDYVTGLPNWVPGRVDKPTAAQYCLTGKSYSGGWVQQVAYVENNFEVVYACGNQPNK